jgi:hypothetical protein
VVWILYQTLKDIGVRTSWLSYDDDDRVVISGWGTWSAKGSFDVSFGKRNVNLQACTVSSIWFCFCILCFARQKHLESIFFFLLLE